MEGYVLSDAFVFGRDVLDMALAREIVVQKPPLLLFGIGKVGMRVCDELVSIGYEIEAILDNQSEMPHYKGIPVVRPEVYANTVVPVVVATREYRCEMEEQLERLRIFKRVPYFFYLLLTPYRGLEYQAKRWEVAYIKNEIEGWHTDDSIVLPSIDIQITERCSLHCHDCANLMQYYKEPQHENRDTAIAALKKLLGAVDHINDIIVLGGEPFINREFTEYLNEIKTLQGYSYITILTNGTIIPNEEAMQAMKDPRVLVIISEYESPKQRCAELSEALRGKGIRHLILPVTQWQDCARIEQYARTPQENRQIYDACCMTATAAIKAGRFYCCPFAANAAALRAIPARHDQSIALLDEGVTREALRSAIRDALRRKPLDVCDYCAGRPWEQEEGGIPAFSAIPAAIQTQESRPYEIYEEG